MRRGILLALFALPLAAPAAQAYSASISVSADPVAGQGSTITTSGTSDAARDLFVYVERAGVDCAATAAAQAARPGIATATSGKAVNGAFSDSASYAPSLAAAYRVCAYVSLGSSAVPDTTATAGFTARAGSAGIAITVPPDPVVNVSQTIVTSGSSELARKLYVYAEKNGSVCAATASAQNLRPGPSLTNGKAVTAAFTETDKYKPDAVASYRICAYVATASTATPDAVGTAVFAARASAAAIQIGAAGADTGFGAQVTASGRSDKTLKLYVYARRGGGGCSSTARAMSRQRNTNSVISNLSVSGAYSKVAPLATQPVTTYRLCAYLTSSSTARPTSKATGLFVAQGIRATALRRQSLKRRKAVLVSVVCGEACTITSRGRVNVRAGKLKPVTKSLKAFRRTTLRLKFSRRALPAIKRRLKRGKAVSASVLVRQAGGAAKSRVTVFSRK